MKQSGFGIVSLVLGIVGILLSCIAIGIVSAIIGLILAIIGLSAIGKKHGPNDFLATTGIDQIENIEFSLNVRPKEDYFEAWETDMIIYEEK